MASDAEKAGNVICGKWKCIRDENIEACLKHMGASKEDIQYMVDNKPSMAVTREGDTFKMSYSMGAEAPTLVEFKLGKEFHVKDNEEAPTYHTLECFTLEKDGSVKCVTKAQMPNAQDSQTVYVRKGNELHNLMSKIGDTSIVANRVMVPDE